MTRKQWAALTLILLAGGLGGIVGSVVLVDPFEIYHQATAFIPPITNGTQIYSNAGIAKSYAYDSIVIGSSMTENFKPSQLDALFGGQFVKIPVNAGSPFNHKQMMDMAFSTHDVRRVLYGIDIELMTYFYTAPKCEMPDYLYDDNLLNDVQYWFNQSVLARYIPECLATLGRHSDTLRDDMYSWGDLYEYGKDAALRGFTISGDEVSQVPLESDPQLSQQTLLNVQYNLIPFIEAHPGTEFLFFFPPYSLARWVDFYQSGMLHYHMNQKEAIVSALLPYENVKIFDFQAQTDWITALDNYIDISHYGPWINEAMAQAICENRLRITSVSQAQENDAVIRRYVDFVRAQGAWPESFAALSEERTP
ncbi:MAG: hypothetical protein Q4F18_01430 [Clostridia bacterium]|nr:hypothetical protein [Clostridia bacterium]